MRKFLTFAIAACAALLAAVPARAAQDCSPAGIAATRAAASHATAARRFDEAVDLLVALGDACVTGKPIARDLAAVIANDTARAEHRNGADDDCLQQILGYADPGLKENLDHPLPPSIKREVDATVQMCRPACASYSAMNASCQWLSIIDQEAHMIRGSFAARPCPFQTDGSPTLGLPDGSCLIALAPRQSRKEDDDDPDPRVVCPRLARVRPNAAGRDEPVGVPANSFLRQPVACCAAIDLHIDATARIEIVPSHNPPDLCRSGHTGNVQQDLFRLDGDRLVLLYSLGVPND